MLISQALAQKARYIQAVRILRQWQDGDEVATVYEIDVQTPARVSSPWT